MENEDSDRELISDNLDVMSGVSELIDVDDEINMEDENNENEEKVLQDSSYSDFFTPELIHNNRIDDNIIW